MKNEEKKPWNSDKAPIEKHGIRNSIIIGSVILFLGLLAIIAYALLNN
jgi:hypothetical protein